MPVTVPGRSLRHLSSAYPTALSSGNAGCAGAVGRAQQSPGRIALGRRSMRNDA